MSRLSLVLATLLAPLSAQVAWQSFPAYSRLPSLSGYGFCQHEQSGRTVLFGGQVLPGGALRSDTWEWDGISWQQRLTTASPPAGYVGAMVYDSARHVVVLVDPAMQPWEYDGLDWTPRPVPVAPSSRTAYSCAFDRVRGRTVLFGGRTSSYAHLNDTWEWDGTQWTQATPANSPQVRAGAAMVFDPARQRLMLLGGGEYYPWPSNPVVYQDHWEWDGVNWVLLAIASPVAAGALTTAHLQRNRVVAFPYLAFNTPGPWTYWEWDGSSWSTLQTSIGPNRPIAVAPPYDPARNRIVWFGGFDLQALGAVPGMTSVWEWDTIAWQLRGTSQPPRPATRYGHGFAYFAPTQSTVMFGGSDAGLYTDTWEWNGSLWTQRQPAVSPPGRYTTRMAAHPSRGEIVLFGGQGLNGVALDDTWIWNGTTWAQRSPTSRPTARYGHAMACDTLRDRVVLYGGSAGNTTHEWDGVNWVVRNLPASPPARTYANMAFDVARARMVLFGGVSRSDTWEYDGVTWVQRSSGPPQGWPMLAYDEARARTVLFGNDGQAWEFDGTAWAQRATNPAPVGRSDGGLAYDPLRRRIVLFSGINAGTKDDIWEYGPTTPALWTPFGSGCAGSLGTPTLAPAPGSLPWLGSTFELRASPVPAGQAAIVALGSRVQWGGVPLPLPLGGYGMPGCTLFAGGDSLWFVPTVGAVASLSLAIPNLPFALGVEFDAQAAVLDPAANSAGLVVTGAGTMTMGGR